MQVVKVKKVEKETSKVESVQLKKSAQPKMVAKAEAKPKFDNVQLKRVSTEAPVEDFTPKGSTIPDLEKVVFNFFLAQNFWYICYQDVWPGHMLLMGSNYAKLLHR